MRLRPVATALLVVALLTAVSGAVVAVVAGWRSPGEGPAEVLPALAPAHDFLDRYVGDDGRVERPDEGGDTVSEGQAYALLLSVAVDDREGFERVWTWTEGNLQRDDGLLAWHWADGRVVDPEPAADADLDAAWALTLAARRWPDAGFEQEARRLARAIAEQEATGRGSGDVLLAGPWAAPAARADGVAIVNPSYLSPLAESALVAAGIERRSASRRLVGGRAVVRSLVDTGGGVPDWARLGPDGAVAPTSGPDDGGPGRFGWDAVRVPLRFAAGCDPLDRAVARDLWPAMQAGAGVDEMGDHPARLVGAAAAAAAAGEGRRAEGLLAEARAAQERHPTYYGGALTALAHVLLATDELGGCPPLAPDLWTSTSG